MDAEKLFETMAAVCEKPENLARTRSGCKKRVVLYRMAAREIIRIYLEKRENLRAAVRMLNKSGLKFPLFESHIHDLRAQVQEYRELIAEFGGFLICALDEWQESGATFGELCSLCCISEERGRELTENKPRKFSEYIFVDNLDYKGTGDMLEWECDAPLTHSVKEAILKHALGTEQGVQACREAFQEIFPEVWEGRITRFEHEDGTVELFTADGDPAETEETP